MLFNSSLRVVLRVDGDVVAGVVADSRARDVDLDVHAAPVRRVRVQVPVHLQIRGRLRECPSKNAATSLIKDLSKCTGNRLKVDPRLRYH